MDYDLVSTESALEVFLDDLVGLGTDIRLYVDLEGNNLGRHDIISIMTIMIESQTKVYLVDVTQLKVAAFTTAAYEGTTLQDILESKSITKVFFDIRTDSDALFPLYGVHVDGVHDLQLMELSCRTEGRSRRCLKGLAKCIELHADLTFADTTKWLADKALGRKLFDPNCGGSYSVFDQRPLSFEILRYCCQDVSLMPGLYKGYRLGMCDMWWLEMLKETQARIVYSHSANFRSNDFGMALGPTDWLDLWPNYSEYYTTDIVLDDSLFIQKAVYKPSMTKDTQSAYSTSRRRSVHQ